MLRSLAFVFLLATPAMGQEKTFDFKGITNIDVRNGVTVNVVPGDEVKVTATARSGDVDHVVIRKFGAWLAINRNTRWFIFPYGRTDDIVVTVTLPELSNIKAFDAAVATATGFDGDTLRAEALQGGTVSVTDISADTVTLNATEGGALAITGTCGTVVGEAIIDATIAADELLCDSAAITTRRGGTVTANAQALASQDATAGGTITLLGSPQIVEFLPGMEPAPDTAPEG